MNPPPSPPPTPPRSPWRWIAETAARPPSDRPLTACVLFVAALTAWRVAGLAFNRTDLYVDESQYWFWSLDPAFGYFSKPPLIAWVIGLSTWLGGSDAAFWVRLPAPLMQGAAALLVAALGARLFGARIGALAGASYATLPGATAGSMVISTDTVLAPFLALALLLLARPAGRAAGAAAGLAAGLGFLAKYAMAYFWLCLALAAAWRRDLRPPGAWTLAALAAFAAAIAPNLWWNLANDLTTLSHTAANAGPARASLQWGALAEFVGAQFGVMGPVLFAAWLAALGRAAWTRRATRAEALLIAFSAPIVAAVCVQALRAGANANWAAAAFVAATPLAVALLADAAPRLLRLSLALTTALALLAPVAAAFPEGVRAPGGPPVLRRMMGQAALARELEAAALAAGAVGIVADNRAILAALTHALRDGALAIHAPRPEGPPPNHYAMAIPLPPDPPTPLLVVTERAAGLSLPGLALEGPIAEIRKDDGFFRRRTLRLFVARPSPAP